MSKLKPITPGEILSEEFLKPMTSRPSSTSRLSFDIKRETMNANNPGE